jgi:hypothetical protein
MSNGTVLLPSMDQLEIKDGVILIGEPTPIMGTDRLRCLANVYGMLAVVELRMRFIDKEAQP